MEVIKAKGAKKDVLLHGKYNYLLNKLTKKSMILIKGIKLIISWSVMYFSCACSFRCDRIIWYGNGLKQHIYTRGDQLKMSDHRPVIAMFTAEVAVLRSLKGFHSFFRSDRFEPITNHCAVSSADDILCKGRSSFQM